MLACYRASVAWSIIIEHSGKSVRVASFSGNSDQGDGVVVVRAACARIPHAEICC